jgi:hypothetical protein
MKGSIMKKTDRKDWTAPSHKDTYGNLALLVAGMLILFASVTDLPREVASQAVHVAYQQH